MEDERQMEVSSASISCITCLPREILVKILSGLPAKCAVRFRCSCKFFYCYIPEPRFAFTIRFVLPNYNEYPAPSRLYSVSYSENDESVQKLDARGLVWSSGSSSSCAPDGKMCLLRMRLFGGLFDLSTGRRIYLPPNYPAMYFSISNGNIIGNGDFVLTRRPRNSSTGMCPFVVLGFDSISKRYKVFASLVLFYSGEEVFLNRQWVLTLEVDESWREIRSTIIPRWTDAALHIHGIIYFIPNITEQESSSKIVAMDVATEKVIRFIPFPSGYDDQSWQRAQGWVPWIKLNGRLAFIDIITNIPTREREDDDPHPDPAESKIEIWTLEITSMEEEEEWEKQTVLLPLEESELIEQATSIGFTSNSVGEILILLRSKIIISPLILIYSFRRDVWRRIEIRGASKYSSYFSDMESVVHVDDEITVSYLF